VEIRRARIEDGDGISRIYGPIVQRTAISFEWLPPTAVEMADRVATTLRTHPWLVADDGDIAGYAYATQYAERASYAWSVSVSVYVREDVRGSGLGRQLYTELFRQLRLQGAQQAFAGITLPNAASVALHESMGFRPVGVLKDVGWKLDAWHDVGLWQLTLRS
jgi:L-amino acid N-acyltransferase YncA